MEADAAVALPQHPAQLTKKNSSTLSQVGGHPGSFKVGSRRNSLSKTSVPAEAAAYESLQQSDIARFAPQYHGFKLCEAKAGAKGKKKDKEEAELELENLTAGLDSPCIMDVKIGKRTFLESEVYNTEARMDLLDKMLKADPTAPTDAEREQGVTKLRYMQFRESASSTATLGWRIEGISRAGEDECPHNCKELREVSDLKRALLWFTDGRPEVHAAFVAQLRELRTALEGSEWFGRHEVVGSSLLFVYDGEGGASPAASASVKMIDFAKTAAVAEGAPRLSHRAQWVVGNREDGYMTGLDSLLATWESLKMATVPKTPSTTEVMETETVATETATKAFFSPVKIVLLLFLLFSLGCVLFGGYQLVAAQAAYEEPAVVAPAPKGLPAVVKGLVGKIIKKKAA